MLSSDSLCLIFIFSLLYSSSSLMYGCVQVLQKDWISDCHMNVNTKWISCWNGDGIVKRNLNLNCQKKLISLTPLHLKNQHFLSLKTTQAIVYGHSERGYVCFSAHRSRSVCVLILKYHDLSCNITWLCVFFCSPICKT